VAFLHLWYPSSYQDQYVFLIKGLWPLELPLLFASRNLRVLAREWMTLILLIIRPSLMSLRMDILEFASAISLTSLGSSQTRFLPTLSWELARRFYNRKFTISDFEIKFDFLMQKVNSSENILQYIFLFFSTTSIFMKQKLLFEH
jgi:hypothetical protein